MEAALMLNEAGIGFGLGHTRPIDAISARMAPKPMCVRTIPGASTPYFARGFMTFEASSR